jgi:hypothetical protein
MDIRTDRVGVLMDQLVQSADLSRARLTGLTQDEYLWEPYEDMWSIRPAGSAATAHAFGPGEWVLDIELDDPFAPGPITTIAWRVNHVTSGLAGRSEWTFGSRSIDPRMVVDFSPDVDVAVARLWHEVDRWVASVTDMTDEQLEVPGYGAYPQGLDPQIPFIGILWWVNREFIHHLAEVALLRDLYAREQR